MVALRDALRWWTQGAWVQDLPPGFQWLGLSQSTYPVVTFAVAVILSVAMAWGLRNLAAGRAVYATGSNPEGARLAGIRTSLVTFGVFAITGALTGFAAALNSVRFNQIPSNAGLGLEMKVIARWSWAARRSLADRAACSERCWAWSCWVPSARRSRFSASARIGNVRCKAPSFWPR